jgi:hypothetical protein
MSPAEFQVAFWTLLVLLLLIGAIAAEVEERHKK